jgi:uncharacterized protein YutE (UPF0331/DUF86 family)
VTVRPAIVLARLAHLGTVLAQLERLGKLSAEERAREPLLLLAAERALHVAAEAIFDIGHHVLAGRGRPLPATYREVVPDLVREGVLAAELGSRLVGLAGLRNILVHDYIDVDAARVWELIDARLGDLWDVHRALGALPELARGV